MEFLERTFYENTVLSWFIALAVTSVVLLILRLGRKIAVARLRRLSELAETRLDDIVTSTLGKTKFWFLLILSIKAGSLVLVLPAKTETLISSAAIVAAVLQAGIWGNSLIGYLVSHYLRLEAVDQMDVTPSKTALTFIGKMVLWIFVFLMILNNLEIDITTLITGLGIGGIAVALAAQNILGDLFASMSILFDKPFVVGDFVVVGEIAGSIERIGLKTTRVRSLSGEQVIFSNTDLLASRIRNFKRMYERRIVFTLGVTYSTPYEKLARISTMIKDTVEAQEKVRFDRAHFKEYGDSALVFEVVYFVLTPDFGLYMETQQRINLGLFRRFEEEGIEFAFPTRTIYLNRVEPAVPSREAAGSLGQETIRPARAANP